MPLNHLAAIDIGTNSFHLIIVEVTGDGKFEIIDREKEVIRLAEGNERDIKRLNPAAVERAIQALITFKKLAETYNAEIYAVATSAVRESINKNEFIDNVYERTGIRINVISGNEEARLIYLGMLGALPVYNDKILCVDIGGGSTEFLIGERGEIHYSNSLKLGAVRMTQQFFPDGKVTKKRITQCREWVEGELFPILKFIKQTGFNPVVGSSGTIQAAASMGLALQKGDAYVPEILNNLSVNVNEIFKVRDMVLSKKDVESRLRIKGLESKRADIIPAGIIILSTILEKLGAEQIKISGYALREGIILDAIRRENNRAFENNVNDVRCRSIEQMASSFNYDLVHCRHVAVLALDLFEQLKSLHKLDPKYKEYLYAAALLHDIGHHISHDQHHKHSYYIIRNSSILGFTDLEIVLIANIARYHRKSHPKKKHEEFNLMPADFQNIARKLSSILRVADALDRTHSAYVNKINCIIGNSSVKLKIDHNGSPIDIELWNLNRRKALFEETFGLKLTVS